jgi:hypothetical protein
VRTDEDTVKDEVLAEVKFVALHGLGGLDGKAEEA